MHRVKYLMSKDGGISDTDVFVNFYTMLFCANTLRFF